MPKNSSYILTTDRQVRAAKAKDKRTDFRVTGAPGLQLRVTKSGTKSWNLAYKSPVTGKWAKIAFGRYPSLSVSDAREKAFWLSSQVKQGIDPILDRHVKRQNPTFSELARLYLVEHTKRNKRLDQVSASTTEAQRILDNDILPKIGDALADQISRQMIVNVVQTVADRNALVASDRTLGLIRAIYNWASGIGKLNCDPTKGLKKRNASRPRTRVLSVHEIRIFWTELANNVGMTESIRDALRLQLLTGLRIGEVMGAKLEEIDFEKRVLTIPAHRTKAKRLHQLPLSHAAIDILNGIKSRTLLHGQGCVPKNNSPTDLRIWLFPSNVRGQHIDPHAATRAVLRNRDAFIDAGINNPFNTHDLRRTCATQLAEIGTSEDIIARILNHAPRTVTGRHYNHATYLAPMRDALEKWSLMLLGTVSSTEKRRAAPAKISKPSNIV